MRNVCAAVLAASLSMCAASLTEAADPPNRTLPHQVKCAIPLPPDFWDDPDAQPFRQAEEWAWNDRICLGKWADMREAPGGNGAGDECEPAVVEKNGDAVPAYRKLRPKFLELILSHEPWVSAPRHPEVGIEHALVCGDIYLDDHEIAPGFWFRKSKIDGEVSLLGTRFKRSFSLSGSTVTGKINADRMKVESNLFLRDGTFAEIDLLGAIVTGNTNLNRSTVTGKINADSMETGGNLFLRHGKFADIHMYGANVARNVELSRSNVTGKINADRMEVEGSLVLLHGTFADIDLLSAIISLNTTLTGSTVTGILDASYMKVGNSLLLDNGSFADVVLFGAKIVNSTELDDATVTGRLNANNMEVGGDFFLRDGSLRAIDMVNIKIGGVVRLAGSTFGGEFNLTGTTIGGELHLSAGRQESPPVWQSGASLILRNVKANVLQAKGRDWLLSEEDSKEDKFLSTDLTGFTFNGLAGLDASGDAGMGDESAEWLIKWIEAQRGHGEYYDPQPYVQLAQVLEAAGATDKAKAIRYAKFEHKHDHDRPMSDFRHWLLTFERWFVGYGVYPFVAVYWFIGLVVLGALLAQCSRDRSVRGWIGLWYSLENALPLIETNGHFRDVEHGRAWLAHIFHLQKALGFLLATILVGALTLLSGYPSGRLEPNGMAPLRDGGRPSPGLLH